MAFRRRSSGLRPSRTPRRSGAGPGLGRWATRAALILAALVVVLRALTGGGPPDAGSVRPGDLLSGRVTHVRDGDTIEVAGVPVRLAALDCPELGTPAGAIAATALRRAARLRRVTCTFTGRTSYDRLVGTCVTQDGRDLAEPLLADGFCQPFD